MDENLELEQEIDEAFAEIEEADDETEDLAESEDTDDDNESGDGGEADETLEYDEDGNVIVAEEDETVTETNNEVEAESKPVEQTGTETDTGKTDVTEYDNLKKKHDDREALIRDVLKIVGINEADIDQGLAKLAAETEGVTVEEFLKKRAETLKSEEAKKYYNQMLLNQMVAKDMSELHVSFPETKNITKFEDIPNARRYAELRDLGLSVREAYNAANPEARREAISNSVKQQTINASKSHLQSNVPVASRDTSVKISRGDMETLRDLFPDKSDKEIIALYKKTE